MVFFAEQKNFFRSAAASGRLVHPLGVCRRQTAAYIAHLSLTAADYVTPVLSRPAAVPAGAVSTKCQSDN